MSNEVEFVQGIRVFKPFENAPEFIKCALVINKEELIQWLYTKEGNEVRIDVKESKSGKYYCSVNNYVKQQATPDQYSEIGTIPGEENFSTHPADDNLMF